MSKQYIVILTVDDKTTFNQLRDADWSKLPKEVEGFRISTATSYAVPERTTP